jgi:hypothetical protein
MPYRRWLFVFVVTASICACRGTGTPSIPPSGDATRSLASQVMNPAIAFVQLGPTHMTSGGIPGAGKVNAYVSDPANPNLIYLASGRGTGLETYSSAGIYRTSNGGASWEPVVTGLTDTSGLVASVVNALWMDPNDSSTLLAATEYDGIFRTSNGGTTWRNVYRSTQATQFDAIGADLYATSSAGVLVSKNSGATWSVSLSGVQPTALGSASHAAGSVLYAGTTLGVIEILKGGTWHRASTLPFTPDTHTQGSTPAIHQLAVDPLVPENVYASTNDGRWDQALFGSTDGGKTWVAVLKNLIYQVGLGSQAIAFSVVHPHRLYIGTDGAFFYIQGAGTVPRGYQAAPLSVIDLRDLWISPGAGDDNCTIASDQGLDRATNCSTPARRRTDKVVSSSIAMGLARHFAISPLANTLFVSLQDFDSHVTFNGGRTWYETKFYEDGFNELRPGNPSVCYVLDEAYGLSVSTDGCRTFPKASLQRRIVPSRLMTNPIAFDPKNPLVMYLLSGPIEAPGISGVRAVFRTTDGGKTIAKTSWPFTHAGGIVVDGRDGLHIIVSDLRSSASSLSTTFDGGKTWTRAQGVPPTAFWYTMSISPVNGQTVLAASVDASANVFVLRSSDGGRTFARTQTVTSAPALAGRIDAGDDGDDGGAAAFLYSPVREIRYNQDHKTGISDAVLTTLRGAFISGDDGSTWQCIDDTTIAHSFWGVRWNSGYLYLGSDGQGLLRSVAAVQPH